MTIGVNSRLYENNNKLYSKNSSGIQYFIQMVFNKLQLIDSNRYIFFQINNKKKLGDTKIFNRFKFNFLGILYDVLFDWFFVYFLIKRENIDIFISPHGVLPLFKRKNTKYIAVIHDLAFFAYPNFYSPFFTIYYKISFYLTIKLADKIVVGSQNTKNDLIKFYNLNKKYSKRIEVVYYGVNDFFYDNNKQKNLIKEKYIISVVTHRHRKNVNLLFKLFAQNIKELNGYKLVLVGTWESEGESELLKKIESLNIKDRVILFGYASEDELISLYQNAQMLIYPSFYEGFGLPIVEAMISKCLVLSSNSSSMIEVNPDSNYRFNPYSIDELEDRVVYVMNLTKEEKDKKINENFEFVKQFNWQNTALKFKIIMDKLKI